MTTTICQALANWSEQDLANLGVLLDMQGSVTSPDIEQRLKWLFHSKTAANAEMLTRNLALKWKKEQPLKDCESLRALPSYDELVLGACSHLKAAEDGAPIADHELFLSHAIIVSALQAMTPRQRAQAFTKLVDPSKICPGANVSSNNISAPVTTLALLGVAQLSGFGVFAAATTALGFLTHAVGVTLPFVFYSGLSSTIAFIIGPVGWLSAGVWGAWTLTKAEWKKIIPGLIYIIAHNSRTQGQLLPRHVED